MNKLDVFRLTTVHALWNSLTFPTLFAAL